MQKSAPDQFGPVYLVGAGPGDPGLITLREVEALRRADLVLYDYLVNAQILEHVRPGAECLCLGRHGRGRLWTQEEIIAHMIAAARAGRVVVRLKGGDPAIFARAGEETSALSAAGVCFEIVPGITTALAAGSHAGINLTDRHLSSAVALVTGHEQEEKHEPSIDFRALGAFPGTVVVYMGVQSVRDWSAALVEGGKGLDTPVAIVRRCSWPDQAVAQTSLGELAETVARLKLRPPVIFIIGATASHDPALAWFASRPLFGQTVLVTRAEQQSATLRDQLQELGADVRIQPAIMIEPPEDWSAVDAVIERLDQFDWLVFSSANGVRGLLNRIWARGGDLRALVRARIAAIGPGTAEQLAEYRLRADLMPETYRAEHLAAALAPAAAGKRFLLLRASRGREILAEQLRAAGGEVEQVVVYRSLDVPACEPEIKELLDAGRIDWITVTSSAIARSLVQLIGDRLRTMRLASISPITSQTLREFGHAPTVEATEYTMTGLVQAMLKFQARAER